MNLNFRTKIFLSIALILVLGLTLVFFASTPVIESQIEKMIDEQIMRAYETVQRVQEQKLQTQTLQGSLLSVQQDISAAILSLEFDPTQFQRIDDTENNLSSEDYKKITIATINQIVLDMLTRFRNLVLPDFLLFTTLDGEIIVRKDISPQIQDAKEYGFWALTQMPDTNNTLYMHDGKLYQVILERVEDSGEPNSYFILGFEINSEQISSIVGNRAAHDTPQNRGIGDIYVSFISSEGEALATNIPESQRGSYLRDLTAALDETGGDEGALEFDHHSDRITGRYWRITDASGSPIGYEAVVTSKTEALAILGDLQRTSLLVALVTLVLAGIVGYIMSRSVTKPVDVLVNAAHELSNGNLEYKISYQSKDEMGVLSDTLDQMRVAILNRIKQIQSLQDQLIQKEKLATIGSMASAINHEIRNQLSFGMAAELIRRQYPNDTQVQSYTEMILDARDYILRMLDDIRNFSRANQNVEYTREPKPLMDTLTRTVAFTRFDKEMKHIEIEETYEDIGNVVCDHQRIGQVVINLIRNAGHAMEKEGRVDVRLKAKDGMSVIEVEDRGCGIPPENLEKIWQSFFSTKGEKGLGLGLDICKRIIEDHGGKIYCTSKVGVGTTFFVELPMNVEE